MEKNAGFDLSCDHRLGPERRSQEIHPDLPDSGSIFCVPEGFLALIREKPALLFWESHGPLPIRFSGAELQLEITANSTYWEAKLRFYGME
jgi:hypothetical protein